MAPNILLGSDKTDLEDAESVSLGELGALLSSLSLNHLSND